MVQLWLHSDCWTTVPFVFARNVLFWSHYPKIRWKVYLCSFPQNIFTWENYHKLGNRAMAVSLLVSFVNRHRVLMQIYWELCELVLHIRSIDSMINKLMWNTHVSLSKKAQTSRLWRLSAWRGSAPALIHHRICPCLLQSGRSFQVLCLPAISPT